MLQRGTARLARRKFTWDLPRAEPLAYLDGDYRTLEHSPELTAADLDEQVLAEARRLTA